MNQIMWSQTEKVYRGQATGGTVISIDEDAMDRALRKAGQSVFECDWWIETLSVVLEHWGLKGKRWMDPATQVPRLHYSLVATEADAPSGPPPPAPPPAQPQTPAPGPLTSRLMNSGKLNSGQLNSGKLSEDQMRKTKDEGS
jgi:hypothetical protein